MKKRIIIDTQSNRLFQGIAVEQSYDQRGSLCQAGKNDVIITTSPINEDYLRYWSGIGFDLPRLFIAGPFDPRYTLSELIMNNQLLMEELKEIASGDDVRLEFFTIEEAERLLSQKLGIQPYCSFDVSIHLSRKHNFKAMCEEIGLVTPKWTLCEKGDDFHQQATAFLNEHGRFLLKSTHGTGGIACGGMAKIETQSDINALNEKICDFGDNMVLEKIINGKQAEVSIHWEITVSGELKIIDIFGQLAVDFGYAGAYYPVLHGEKSASIRHQLESIFAPVLKRKNAIGFYCCDIIIDKEGEINWVDFNPRKGAILYAYSMVRRMADVHFGGRMPHFFHKHNKVEGIDGKGAFMAIQDRLVDLLVPNEDAFVIVTNPGAMEFGHLDITGISPFSLEAAKKVSEEALKRF